LKYNLLYIYLQAVKMVSNGKLYLLCKNCWFALEVSKKTPRKCPKCGERPF